MAETAHQHAPPASGELHESFAQAALALADMQKCRVLPTPRAYDLWLTYRAGSKPALTARLEALLGEGDGVSPAVINMLRDEFELDGAHVDAGAVAQLGAAQQLDEVAASLLEHANAGSSALRDYGAALAHGMEQLGRDADWADSRRVISLLEAETAAAAARNRALEAELAATAARADRLRKLLQDQRRVACTDQLTGLANRRVLDTHLKRALARLGAEPSASASLLMLDVDHFKRFNDMHGHRAGDLVLRLVGRLLIAGIKGRDLAARYGGEEFAVVLVGAGLDAAANVARQLCATLANQRLSLSKDGQRGYGRVTISIGVAQMRVDDTAKSALERADQALYAAKHAGRNRVLTERDLPG